MPAVPAPKGLAGMLGKKKYAAEVASATRWYQQAYQQWQAAVAAIPMQQLAVMQAHQQAEQERLTRLATDRDTYDRAQAELDAAAEAHNAELDELIDGLARGHADAVEEYIGIVLNRSAYPEGLDVAEEISYDPATHELTVHLSIPPKDVFPAVRSYKYQKSSDHLVATPWSPRPEGSVPDVRAARHAAHPSRSVRGRSRAPDRHRRLGRWGPAHRPSVGAGHRHYRGGRRRRPN